MNRPRTIEKAMPELIVVLVEPRVEGNVGAVARSMTNFGFRNLVLVNPCRIGEDAYRRAKRGRDILEAATITKDLRHATASADLVIGSTGISSRREELFRRQTLPPWEMASKVAPLKGRVALLIGREDYGLYNEELEEVDILVHVPCTDESPVMNVSHATTIILYELFRATHSSAFSRQRTASGFEKERLNQAFSELLTAISYPEHKRRRTKVMFRRLMGRATPSKWEFHAFMGVLRGAAKTIRRLSESPERGPSS